jgi:hypothetical protein
MMAEPAVIPVTTPEPEPTVTFELLLDHVPPVSVSVNVVEEPAHTLNDPVITEGRGLTVSTEVVRHPVAVNL